MVELSSKDSQPNPNDLQWVPSVDGSSNQQGSGAGVIIEGSNGLLIEQALKFAFKASNNQVGYEAFVEPSGVQALKNPKPFEGC